MKTADNIDLNESYGAEIVTVNASITGDGVQIIGNKLDNSMKGGKGADTYYYIGGDDIISDYATIDALQFDTENISDFSREISGKNVIFKTDAGTLTVKNASTKNITILDGNGEDFNISQNVAENLWFMEYDFTACDLDSITEQKFEVTQIQTANYNFEQEQNILTYGEDK